MSRSVSLSTVYHPLVQFAEEGVSEIEMISIFPCSSFLNAMCYSHGHHHRHHYYDLKVCFSISTGLPVTTGCRLVQVKNGLLIL